MNQLHLSLTYIARETAKSVAGGLFGATVTNLASWRGADPIVIHAMRDVAHGMLPMISVNALMSCLIPAVLTLRRTGTWRSRTIWGLSAALAAPAAFVLGLTFGATVATLILIHMVSFAFALPGLAANGILLVGAGQAVLVGAFLTPLTIVILSKGSAHD